MVWMLQERRKTGGGYNLEGKIRATGFIQKKTGEYKKPQMKSDPVMKLPTAYDIVLTPAKEERELVETMITMWQSKQLFRLDIL